MIILNMLVSIFTAIIKLVTENNNKRKTASFIGIFSADYLFRFYAILIDVFSFHFSIFKISRIVLIISIFHNEKVTSIY